MTAATKPDLQPTIETLNVRLTALEEFVHEEVIPRLDNNTAMTATIHAQSDEMYAAFIAARNGIRMLAKVGDGAIWVSDVVEKRPKTLLVLAVACGAAWGFLSTGRVPDWLLHVMKLLVA
jgi:hypothetical protein